MVGNRSSVPPVSVEVLSILARGADRVGARRYPAPVLVTEALAAGEQFGIHRWTCPGERPGWEEVEPPVSHRLALVRSGVFRRRSPAGTAELDQTVGYVGLPYEHEEFAHPGGGDDCTAVSIGPALWAQLAGAGPPVRPTVYVDARMDLAHRQVLRACAGQDHDFGLPERLLALLAAVALQVAAGRVPVTDRSHPADCRLVDQARSAIRESIPAARGLVPLAELLGASPYRLSRAFSRELGVSLTRYRNRVRVGRALDRLEQGDVALAELAVELGFADQAHLTRTVGQHVGLPPGALRDRLLRRPDAAERAGVPRVTRRDPRERPVSR